MNFNSEKEIENIITNLIEISISAGKEIMEIYRLSNNYQIKKDGSPVTLADKKSHETIINELEKIDRSIPVISEEGPRIPFRTRSKWDVYWLVDPLDGTKEFINKNGEFTTNIALIKNHKPIIGLVHSPVNKATYLGSSTFGSYYVDKYGDRRKLNANKLSDNNTPRVVVSRSHYSTKTNGFLKLLGKHQVVESGSSIKFCMIADDKADIYPRLSPTSEWDTAAGHAVAIYAGAQVYTYNGYLEYNKKSKYINSSFLVSNAKYSNSLSIFKLAEENNEKK